MNGHRCVTGAGACSHVLCARWVSRRYARSAAPWDPCGVETVSLALDRGDRVALLGRSGAGKSTLARCLSLLERPDGGEIWIDGVDALAAANLAPLRRKTQMVQQDSEGAFNPRFTALDAVEEALRYGSTTTADARWLTAHDWLDRLKVPMALRQQRARELSGGERRRVLLARALAAQPSILILDETLTSLDAASHGQIASELFQLQSAAGFALLLITHDLGLALACDRVCVMHEGQLTENGRPADVFERPASSAGRAFAAAARRLMTVQAC